jgi:Tfp pilus assembly protein PilV
MHTTPLPLAPTPRRAQQRAIAGYSLMETLLAIGIFTIGFVGVAAIFPAAAALQKNSAEHMLAEISQRNAKAIATSTSKLTYTYTAGAPSTTTGDLGADNYFAASAPTNKTTVECPATVQNRWSVDMRSYPSTKANLADRDLYWIPLIRSNEGDPSNPNWYMYVVILRRQNNTDYAPPGIWPTDWNVSTSDFVQAYTAVNAVPGITLVDATPSGTISKRYLFNNSDLRCRLRPGDWVLSQQTGTIFKVTAATLTYIEVNGTITATGTDKLWVGVPGVTGNKNPVQAIFTVVNPPPPYTSSTNNFVQ